MSIGKKAGLIVGVIGAAATLASTAEGGEGGHGRRVYYPDYVAPPVIVAPPPRYYAPPPVVVYAPPVSYGRAYPVYPVYDAPSVNLNLNIPTR